MHLLYRSLAHTTATCLFAALGMMSSSVQASGPVERMAQVIIDPNNPMHVVVRFGAASEGVLFSSDGGRTFAASCSAMIDPELDKLSRQGSVYDSTLRMDGRGQLLFGDTSDVWYSNETGCTWTKQAELAGRWIADMEQDPSNGEKMVALSIKSTGDGDNIEARSELMQRSADGSWTVIGPIKPHVARQRAYAAHLVTGKSDQAVRLYAIITTSVGALSATESTAVTFSDDGGKSWREHAALSAEQDRLKLLAVDPLNLDRLLAVVEVTDAPDTLFISDDKGQSFRSYGQINDYTGVAFDPSGRVFIADAGDGSTAALDSTGGAWTAAKLGDALARIPNPNDAFSGLDCIAYDPQTKKLKACKAQRFGVLDPVSGAFDELTRLDLIENLLQCDGSDTKSICEPQLNAGASWCCAGHFPFTPFCGEYDVTKVDNRRVFCGLSGRVQDEANGNGPVKADAGMSDAGHGSAVEAGARDGASGGDSEGSFDAGRGAGKDAGKGVPPKQESTTNTRTDSGGCATFAPVYTSLPTYLLLALAGLLGRLKRRRAKRGGESSAGSRDARAVDVEPGRQRTSSLSVAGTLLFCSVLSGSCSDGTEQTDADAAADSGGHGGHTNSEVLPDAGEEEGDAPCTADYPTFRPGLTTSADGLTIRVVRADPQPPRQKVANDWVVEIMAEDGSPLAGATLANPASYMEVHRHFGKTPPVVTVEPEPGRYGLNAIDFKMRGPWEVLFDVERASEKPVAVRVKVCVE